MREKSKPCIRFVLSVFCVVSTLGAMACSDVSTKKPQPSPGGEKPQETVLTITDGDDGDLYSYLSGLEGKVVVNVSGSADITQDVLKSSLGSSDVEEITVDGGEAGAKIYVKSIGEKAIKARGNALLAFKNVEFIDQTSMKTGWAVWSTEFGGKLYFENCTFKSGVLLKDDADAVFKNCDFSGSIADMYAFWLLDGSATIENCKIFGTRGIKVHEDGTDVIKMIVKNCNFGPLSVKPGFAFGSLNRQTLVDVQGCTFTDCQPWNGNGTTGSWEGINGFYESDGQTTDEFTFTYANNTVDGVACSDLKKEYNEAFIVVD